MQNGISIYAGLDYDSEENISLIETAAEMGFKRLFTSAQVPEAANAETFLDDLTDILTTASLNDFEIIIDVNADNFSQYDIDGITLRLDDGFSIDNVAEISRGRKIMLNASTITEDFLNDLLGAGAPCTIFILMLAPVSTATFSTTKIMFCTISEFKLGHSSQVRTAKGVNLAATGFRPLKIAEIFLLIYPRDF